MVHALLLMTWVRVPNINMTHGNEDDFASRLAGPSPREQNIERVNLHSELFAVVLLLFYIYLATFH